VTDPSDDDPENPVPGTFCYGIVQDEPLWITFHLVMAIRPKQDLLVGSYKTIDGRGAVVVVGDGGACFAVQGKSNVIIHGITIRGCKSDEGDGIAVFRATDVWIDYCTLEACADGLIDVTGGSTRVTLSNNFMRNHDKVMLLGHSDTFSDDKNMQVTVALNRFGPGLVERMPRYVCVSTVLVVVDLAPFTWSYDAEKVQLIHSLYM
jgi:pectate lyase